MKSFKTPAIAALVFCIVMLVTLSPAASAVGDTTLVSVSTSGTQGDSISTTSSISSDGRYVAFESRATNLVSGDTNNATDIFVRDRDFDGNGVFDEPGSGSVSTTRVSVSSSGAQTLSDSAFFPNPPSVNPAISGNGRYVVFKTRATNLVSGDTNNVEDIFVRDRDFDGNGVFDEPGSGSVSTTRVSVSSSGAQALGGAKGRPAISDDGRYVAFGSQASNLVLGDTNARSDIFVHDQQTGATVRVSVSSSGAEASGNFNPESINPAISGNGRYVAFESFATNLVSGDTNDFTDIFVHDRDSDGDGIFDEPGSVSTTRVSVSSSGAKTISDNPFFSSAASAGSAISGNGRYVAFQSFATNLVAGDTNNFTDIFVHDRDSDGNGIFDEPGSVSTTRVSVNSSGLQGNSFSGSASISADGRFVAFDSGADNLVIDDINGAADIFVHDRQIGATVRASVDSNGVEGNALFIDGDPVGFTTSAGFSPSISSDGLNVSFGSQSTNLVAGDTNGHGDVFVHELGFGVADPQLTVIKVVVNDNGGTANAGDFTMNMTATSPSSASFAGSADGTTITLDAGSYSVAEIGPAGYAESQSADCSGTIAGGESKTCTITNDDIAPTLTVIKVVVNDDGGTANAGDFTMNVTATNPSSASFGGSADGTTITLDPGSYSVGETGPAGYTESQSAGYTESKSADCMGTIAVGESKTCTITNNDIAPNLTVIIEGKLDDATTGLSAIVGDISSLITLVSNETSQIDTDIADLDADVALVEAKLDDATTGLAAIVADLAAHVGQSSGIAGNFGFLVQNVLELRDVDLQVITVKEKKRYLLVATEAGLPVDVALLPVAGVQVSELEDDEPVTFVDVTSDTDPTNVFGTGILDLDIDLPDSVEDAELFQFRVIHDHGNGVQHFGSITVKGGDDG